MHTVVYINIFITYRLLEVMYLIIEYELQAALSIYAFEISWEENRINNWVWVKKSGKKFYCSFKLMEYAVIELNYHCTDLLNYIHSCSKESCAGHF